MADDRINEIQEIHKAVTTLIPDEGGAVEVTLAAALRRLLRLARRLEVLVRRSAVREEALTVALQAVATNATANTEQVVAAVNTAIAAITELDEDLPEGEEPEPPATA